jgi:nicotinamidase-related amidase
LYTGLLTNGPDMARPLPLGDPATTAVVFIECQNGVLGDLEGVVAIPALKAARGQLVDRLVELADAARSAGIVTVHATCEGRTPQVPHLAAPLYRLIGPSTEGWNRDHPATQVLPQLLDERDLVQPRRRGLIPTHNTDLLPSLRALGVQTIVFAGASVNIAITGSTFEAVEEGFTVVLPRDAVLGTPQDYVEAVLTNTLGMMATLTDIASLKTHWKG